MLGKAIRSFALIAVLAAFVAGGCTPFDEQKPAVGDSAPAISLADLSGKMLRLADWRGKVVLLTFWANWSPPCRDQMPGFRKVLLAYEDKGFAIIGVAINDVTSADVAALGIPFPVAVANDRVKQAYGDIAFPPVSFLIGRDGRIIKKVKHAYPANELERDVKDALKG